MIGGKPGNRSLDVLATVDGEFAAALVEAMAIMDFSVISGKRVMAVQNDYFERGVSKVRWPNSKHNMDRNGSTIGKSIAVDVKPVGVSWEDWNDFAVLSGVIRAVCNLRGMTVRWGGNWDMDHDSMDDQKFQDLGHFEVVEFESMTGTVQV